MLEWDKLSFKKKRKFFFNITIFAITLITAMTSTIARRKKQKKMQSINYLY